MGTTSVRTLESLYWIGVKTKLNPDTDLYGLEMKQWEVYEELKKINTPNKEALAYLLTWMDNRKIDRLVCRTQILIAPGYSFRMVSGIITNFHQPQSTLLLLIAAFVGKDWKNLYQYALDNDFRFLSYGDGMLVEGCELFGCRL